MGGARRAKAWGALAALVVARAAGAYDFHLWRVKCDASASLESVTWYDENSSESVSRNEQALQLKMHTDPDRRWQVVTSVDLVAGSEMPRVELGGAGVVEENDRWQLRSDAAYLDLSNVLRGLDVRVGRQVLSWGAADVFNPTDTLSAKSFENPIKFGQNLASPALNVHYHLGGFDMNAIYVERFQSPRLPPGLAEQFFTNPGRIPPSFQALADQFFANNGQIDLGLRADVPASGMWGVRVQRDVGGYDMSVSFADTREAVPVLGDLDVKSIDLTRYRAAVDADLVFPRKRVYGADCSGQLPWLDDAGVWAEAAWTVPEPFVREITLQGQLLSREQAFDEGYLKYTLGGDYTLPRSYLVQCQIVRGFIDENEKGLLHSYVIGGFEKSYFQDVLRLRLFETYDMSDGGLLVTPDLLWMVTDRIEVGGGGIVYGGKKGSKFDVTPTGDQYYVRLRYAF